MIFGMARGGRTSAASFTAVARALYDTFAKIAPASVLPFIVAQLAAAVGASVNVPVLWPKAGAATDVVVPHETRESG